ncbi:alanine racemase [Waterburya agarophytonicola K14]|uniref:Alanine racemase n=1 Tax=Waterburya agarophytonicola KI4 TaxID=2874699 RepID=A0A964BRZ9_9CYAN|nr:alanine racemase [Waterburya agarophytonicola]MCC0177712.1 alanine racemase [Waterburya agarophytonicola KI4]
MAIGQQDRQINKTHQQNTLSFLVNRQRAWVEIDLTALAHNVKTLKNFIQPQTKLMAVVKADAYGHGAVAVAQTALTNGADCLAIATLPEGVELRQAGINAPILILGAINAVEDIQAIAAWQLEPTICNLEQALVFDRTLASLGKSLPVHLKLDTGMSRLGTNWQDANSFVSLVKSLSNLKIASIYSHFSTADESDRTTMNLQHQRFQNAITQLKDGGYIPPQIHLANSAATLCDRSCHYDIVRVGLALYGLYPAPHLRNSIELKPVLQVKAKIAQVKIIPSGEGVSYGRKFITKKDTKIAVVGIGYADGIPRNLSNHLQAIVGGKLVDQIGSITMDQLMLDVDHIPDLRSGDIVTLIGQQNDLSISAEDWANTLNTISWEILCSFKHRLPRIYI